MTGGEPHIRSMHTYSKATLAGVVFVTLLLAGCAGSGVTPGQRAASDNHTTAAGGLGLGPQDFNTNGGAFGPDQAGR